MMFLLIYLYYCFTQLTQITKITCPLSGLSHGIAIHAPLGLKMELSGIGFAVLIASTPTVNNYTFQRQYCKIQTINFLYRKSFFGLFTVIQTLFLERMVVDDYQSSKPAAVK